MFIKAQSSTSATSSDDSGKSRRSLRIGMFLGSVVIFGLAFWILETGPQLTGWKSEWTHELRFTFTGLWLMSLVTLFPVSNFLADTTKVRSRLFRWTLVLLAWSLILTIGYGLIRVVGSHVLKQPLEDDFLSFGSLMGAYFGVLVFVVAPLVCSGVFCRKIIQSAVRRRTPKGA